MTFNFSEVTRQDSNVNRYLTTVNSYKANCSLFAKSGILVNWSLSTDLFENGQFARAASEYQILLQAWQDLHRNDHKCLWWLLSKPDTVWEKTSAERDPSCGEANLGSCIMTMPLHIRRCWFVTTVLNQKQLGFHSHRTPPISPQQTFSYSQNWNQRWKDEDLIP